MSATKPTNSTSLTDLQATLGLPVAAATGGETGHMGTHEVTQADAHIEPAHAPNDATALDRMDETASDASLADHKVTLSSKKWFGISAVSVLGGLGLLAFGAITIATVGIGGMVIAGMVGGVALLGGGGFAANKGCQARKAEQRTEQEQQERWDEEYERNRFPDWGGASWPASALRKAYLKRSVADGVALNLAGAEPGEAVCRLSDTLRALSVSQGTPDQYCRTLFRPGLVFRGLSHALRSGSVRLPDLRMAYAHGFYGALNETQDVLKRRGVGRHWKCCADVLREVFEEMDKYYGKVPPAVVARGEASHPIALSEDFEVPNWLVGLDEELQQDVKLPEFSACVQTFKTLARRYKDDDVATLRPNDWELNDLLNKTIASAKPRGAHDETATPTYADVRMAILFVYVFTFSSDGVDGRVCNAVLRALFDKLDEVCPLQDVPEPENDQPQEPAVSNET